MPKFVPDSVAVPSGVETENFRIRMLTVHDVEKDYDAVMTSISHFRGVLGPNVSWPPPDLTLEQDLIGLRRHEKEFQNGSAFAYTVMSLDESRCLGCIYVDPSGKEGYEAAVTLWVRQSELEKGLDEKLFSTVKKWLEKEWWFESVGYPGRIMSWREWEALPEKKGA